ncbi:hypothetical protein [Parendozoicomonas haliclonae]|uniref:DoxX n=1 Tax=Parendozoicomonas haliclonae TaxID=1960125 RepID=A0A1X7APM2_9GAMM|nr:hypothetical protein [Parendozoicomonas haliclonae]SMA50264.1 hypothetical protein EHSB41UT_04058 [Parendozoicomonas haliclonae]
MKSIVRVILCLYIAFVFIQSLFFKFTGAPETVHIFGTLGAWSGFDWFGEYGAWGVGIFELVAAVFLLFGFRLVGALMAAGTMAGAVFFHLFTPLGINMPVFDERGNIVGDDGGLLFVNACAVLLASLIVIVMELHDQDQEV